MATVKDAALVFVVVGVALVLTAAVERAADGAEAVMTLVMVELAPEIEAEEAETGREGEENKEEDRGEEREEDREEDIEGKANTEVELETAPPVYNLV